MRTRARGFTLIEVGLTVAIMLVLATLAYASMSRMRPRANLASTASDLTGLLYNARQHALSTGHYTVVMIFPQQANKIGGVGRAVAYVDATYDFFSATATPNFGGWDASLSSGVPSENLLGSVEFPRGVTVGLGGATAPTLPAPFDGVTASACNFCSTSGDKRGAVVFDSRGSARFYSANGTPVTLTGATLSVTGFPEVAGYSMVLIAPVTGSIRPFVRG